VWATKRDDADAGQQALTPFIGSLFKAIVGSGILSLANSIARWTDNPALILPVCVLSVTPRHSHALVGLGLAVSAPRLCAHGDEC
jgi:hypothetical protein